MKNLKRFDIPASYEADIPKQEYQVSLIENPESVKFDTNIGPPVPKKHTITFPQEFFESPNVDVTLMIDYVSTPIESNVIEVETGKNIFLNIVISDTGKKLYEFSELKCTPAITAFATAQDNTGCSIPGWNIDQDIAITGRLNELPKKYTITFPQEFVNNPTINIDPQPSSIWDGKSNIMNCISTQSIAMIYFRITDANYMFTDLKCTPDIDYKLYIENDYSGFSINNWKPNQNLVLTANLVKRPKTYTFDIDTRLKPICDVLDKSGNKIDVNTLPISITEGTEVAYKIVPKDVNKYKFTSAVATKLSKDSYYKCTESAIEVLPHAMEKNILVDANIDLYYKLTYRFTNPRLEPQTMFNTFMILDENENYLIDESNVSIPVINDTTEEYSFYLRSIWKHACIIGYKNFFINSKPGIVFNPSDSIIQTYGVDGYNRTIELYAKSLIKDTVIEINYTDDRYSAIMDVQYDFDAFQAIPNLEETGKFSEVTPSADQVLIAKS